MTFIYALVDPRDNRVRYVGKSSAPERRLREHIAEVRQGHNHNPYFVWWIGLLEGRRLRPNIREIMVVPGGEANDWERHWIAAFRWAGEKLTNLHDGGTGGATMTGRRHKQETIEKMRAVANANRENRARAGRARKDRRNWNAGRIGVYSEEARAKMSKAARARPRDAQGHFISREGGDASEHSAD